MKSFIVVAMMLSLFACAGTNKQSTTDFNPADHFLGKDYAMLQGNPDLKGGLGWRTSGFNPADYTALYVEPVTVWQEENLIKSSGFKKEELDALAKYFHDVLTRVPDGKPLQLAAQPGPGVITVRAAVVDAEASSPVSNAITSVVPIGILISAGKQVATGQATGVGKCSVEMRFLDSATGKTLSMFADTKVGKKYSASGFSKAGQTEEAMDEWAALMKERIDTIWNQKM